ncbi:hypothetical protein F5876DRAFT_66486 [Lentinula aff. lateritia]|uniref:Uncharacterized protein n=1 Tax=Lentinula aff. lateritia TaxID=2804960 RepID=A0ACC1TX86_9AGAR|nr:hypothetical protein F5876DRAFT_66486 [Lentinula aff. lateritia]
MTALKHLQDNISNCSPIPGQMPVYIGMPCSVIIDLTPVWGTIFDIELDLRECANIPRSAIIELHYPPAAAVVVNILPALLSNDTDLQSVLWTQVPLCPRLAIVEKEVDGQQYDALLIDTERGWDSVCSWYMVGSRVQGHGLINISHKLNKVDSDNWLGSVWELIQLMKISEQGFQGPAGAERDSSAEKHPAQQRYLYPEVEREQRV